MTLEVPYHLIQKRDDWLPCCFGGFDTMNYLSIRSPSSRQRASSTAPASRHQPRLSSQEFTKERGDFPFLFSFFLDFNNHYSEIFCHFREKIFKICNALFFIMQFATWEPIYQAILEDFGFSSARDEEAAKLLAELLRGREQTLIVPQRQLRGRDVVVVCGNAPTLEKELEELQEKRCCLSGSGRGHSRSLEDTALCPILWSLTWTAPSLPFLKANQMGSIVVVHAHGDNLDALKRYVPQLERDHRHSAVPSAAGPL